MPDTFIQKSTNSDKRGMLSNEVSRVYKLWDEYHWPWLVDFDDTYVYFEVSQFDELVTYRVTYSFENTSVSLGDTTERVVRTTEFKPVESGEVEETEVEKSILKTLTKFFGGSKQNTHQVIKQFDEEEMVAIERLYTCAGEVDGHGDTLNLEETRGMVESLNKAIEDGSLQSSFFHTHQTNTFTIEKAWVNETDCTIGDSLVKEGQPIVKVQFHDKDAWELRKEGTLQGLSIGATGTREVIEE